MALGMENWDVNWVCPSGAHSPALFNSDIRPYRQKGPGALFLLYVCLLFLSFSFPHLPGKYSFERILLEKTGRWSGGRAGGP